MGEDPDSTGQDLRDHQAWWRQDSSLLTPLSLGGSGLCEAPAHRSAPLSTGAVCLLASRQRRLAAGSLHTGCGLFSEAAIWGPAPSGPVCLDLENHDVSTAQGCLLIFLEPAEGPWVELRDVGGLTLASQEAKTTLRP